VIQTSACGFDGRAELVSRLKFLREVEIPRLQSDENDAGIAALTYARREVEDIVRLLGQLAGPGSGSHGVVRLNDCVTVHDQEADMAEAMIVHDAGLTIRAPGFISVDSPLGRAVIDRRAGDLVEVQAPRGARRYVIRGIGRD
jgi:transcription elongation GreA/GreB family factor